jgi:DNA-directed RNA polymerase subunit N (RpoN/RPB10)
MVRLPSSCLISTRRDDGLTSVLSSVLQNPVGPSQLQLVQRLAVISHTPLDSLLSHAPFGELGREELEVTLPEVSDEESGEGRGVLSDVTLPAASLIFQIIPVRCFSCGKVIGNLWESYLELLAAEFSAIPFSTSRQHVLSSVLQNPVGPSQLQLVQRLAVISPSSCLISTRRDDGLTSQST